MAWLSGYGYRQKVPLKRVDGAVTDYQMLLTVNKGAGDSSGAVIYLKNHALSWEGTVPNDLRFTKADGTTLLNYWIESSDANTAKVWIEFDSIGTTDTDFYVYYGKSGDTTTSDGDATFLFHDHFPGDSIDTNKWEGDTANTTVADSILTIVPGGSVEKQVRHKTDTYTYKAWRARATFLDATVQERIYFADNYLADMANAAGFYTGAASGYRRRIDTCKAGYWTLFADQAAFILGSYAIFDCRWSADRVEFVVDGVVCANSPITTNVPTIALQLYLSAHTGNNLLVDWIFTKNYAYPEPTWGTWGSEESAGFPHSTGFTIG